ncbi:MAG: T9SS type A sorting domain-containing protein, partial [bacterium]
YINNIFFVNKDTGYVTTTYTHRLFRTVNGGISWDIIVNFEGGINDIKFYNSKIGFLTGWGNGMERYISKTTDGGFTWEGKYSGSNQFSADHISIADDSTIFVTSWCCDLAKSTNKGETWKTHELMINPHIESVSGISFISDKIGFIFGNGRCLGGVGNCPSLTYTVDGGLNWEIYFGLESSWISDLHFKNYSEGWVLMGQGIFHTADSFITNEIIQLNIFNFDFRENLSWGVNSYHVFRSNNNWKTFKEIFSIITGLEMMQNNCFDFQLSQNYPNPFNPTTKIKYTIPAVETGYIPSLRNVTLKVYDVLGREITTLVNEYKSPGTYEIEFYGSKLPSGVYFYQLRAGEFNQTKKMILLE